MTKMVTKTVLAITAGLAMAAATPAAAATIAFDYTGGGCTGGSTTCIALNSFDWLQGNSMIIENADGTGTVLFQANLDSLVGTPTIANGTGGFYYDAVAILNVTLAADGSFTVTGGQLAIFVDDAPADDLAGTGFTDGTLILTATPTSGGGAFLFFPPTDTTGDGICDVFCVTNLDSFNADDYPGFDTLQGAGGSSTDALVTFADPNFFPDLVDGTSLMFTNTSLVDPFRQIDPSATFFGTIPGVSSTCGAGLGGNPCVNGTGDHIMTQADANTSFETPSTSAVPEPASMLLLGTGLIGLAGRRRSRKAN